MAILMEAYSVVLRLETIEKRFGWFQFRKKLVPNPSLLCDGEIVRIGFQGDLDIKLFLGRLHREGFNTRDSRSTDTARVDRFRGQSTECNWLECGTGHLMGSAQPGVAAMRLKNSRSRLLAVPRADGWHSEGPSLVMGEDYSGNGRLVRLGEPHSPQRHGADDRTESTLRSWFEIGVA